MTKIIYFMQYFGGHYKMVTLKRVILLIFLSFTIFTNCDSSLEVQSTDDVINNNGGLGNRNRPEKPPVKEVFYSDCSDQLLPPYSGDACQEPHCNCPGGYSREDLNPCDYDNMEDYALAVVCELNRVSTDCSVPGLPQGCTELEGCIKSLSTPAEFLENHPNTNPWSYCASSDDCNEEWNCPVLNLSFTVHIYLTVEDQDILVAHAWDLATNNAPICPGTSSPSVPYAVYFIICQQGNYPIICENESSTFWTNLDIRLHVLYKCCSPG
ncbi:MAG: hypothetical protein KBF59_09380 [Ignavibacterium sp.]|nr:hypothetical protein [Ignavibacterium sp.]